MGAERYKRARELFAEALEKADATERAAWLAQACGGDVELRQSVEALLQAYEKAGAFLEQPAAGGMQNAECRVQNAVGRGRSGDSLERGQGVGVSVPLT